MPVDFGSAATRHLRTASGLLDAGERDEAAYLGGYAVECSLKAVAAYSGLPGAMWGHRLAELRDEALDLAVALAAVTSRYRPPAAEVQRVRDRWSEGHRYDRTGDHFVVAEAIVGGAGRVWGATVGAMFLDGLRPERPE